MNIGNFIWQLSSGTGTGNLILTEQDSFVKFFDEFGLGDENSFFYGIKNREELEWEVGIGYMLNSTTLVRDEVIRSSNANDFVDFVSGLKDVTCDVPANYQLLSTQLGSMAFENLVDFYNKTAVNALLANKSNVGHTHVASQITNLSTTTVPEGINLYFTSQRAKDAVGSALLDTATIALVYAGSQISANVKTDSINDTHIDWGHGGNKVNAGDLPIAVVDDPTYSSVQDFINFNAASGLVSGGVITNGGGGTVNVSSGTGLIKATDDDVAEIASFDFPSASGIAIPANQIRYIGVEYNAGSPQVVSKISDDWDYDTEFPLGTAIYENGLIFIINRPWKITNSTTNIIERFDSEGYIIRDNRLGGLILGETGFRNITISAGAMLTRLEEYPIPVNDTSGSDTFSYYYRDGLGAWVLTSLNTQYSNAFYDDGSGTLAGLTADYFMSHWVYLTPNNKILVLYGQAQYSTLAELVENDFPPSTVPVRVSDMGILIGRIIIQEGEATATRIDTVFTSSFSPAIVSDHGMLSGLADDDHPQYQNEARADAWLATKSTDDLAEGTNLYYTQARFDTAFAAKSTTDLVEGTNLYYTDGRADARADIRIAAQKGAANGIAPLGADSKIPTSYMPALSIIDVFPVASEAAQVALIAQRGDVAIRSDENNTAYMLMVDDPTIFANWVAISGDILVSSVNGFTGAITLTTTDIAEGTNLYYTQARFDTAFAAKTTTHLAEGANLYYTQGRFDTAFAAKTTGDLAEGANLYYTQGRFDTAFAAKTTTNLTEGTNLYYTQARFDSDFAAKSTTDLAEGTNQYFTEERVDDRINNLIQDGGGLRKSYNDAGNLLSLLTSFATQRLHIQDQKAQNTAGGTFTSGAWRTRDLNTSIINEITGASLATNQITLPAGDYYCEWSAPAQDNGASGHQTRLQNITAATTLRLGQSGLNGGGINTFSRGGGSFTLGVSSVVELQHQITASQTADGFGAAANLTTEVYSDIKIWKL